MGLFDIFKKKTSKVSVETVSSFSEKNPEINVWEIENAENFVYEMSTIISKKCNYGDDIEKLNEKERVFFVAQELEMEVNNGGFSQFFYNSSGDFSGEIVSAFRQIGAEHTANICEKALKAFGCNVPSDRCERQDLMEELEEAIENAFEECDNAFFEYTDNLAELNYDYEMKNKEFFK